MNYLYYGSFIKGIDILKVNSNQHNGGKDKVVYLTTNYVYSLFYIWDSVKNKRGNKYITASFKDGIVYYEEQFPNQFYDFYKGVSGYVYYSEMKDISDDFFTGSEESFYISKKDVEVVKFDYIADVYDKIIDYSKKGLVKIQYYNECTKEKKQELLDKTLYTILKNDLLNEKSENAYFFELHFKEPWEKAKQYNLRKIVTMCGSIKYFDKMKENAKKLEIENQYAVLMPIYYPLNHDLSEQDKNNLGEIHRRKIEISNSIFVVNIGGYIGNTTKSEIEYAKELGKEIMYLEHL